MYFKIKQAKNIIRNGSAIVALSVLLFSNCATVFAADSSISKTGSDVGNGSGTQIRAGLPNKWVLSYDNKSGGPASAQIDDAIPDGSVFSPASVQAPPSWTTSYSNNDGVSYGASDTGTATTNLRFSNETVAESGNGTGQIASQPLASTAQSGTGEDAYIPIPYKGRYFGIVHHSAQASNELVCSSQIANACDNYPVALNLSGQTDFYTSINPLTYIDQSNDRLFFTVQRDTGYGIACWDLASDQLCAGNEYTQLSASGGVLGPAQPSRILGVVKNGSCLHAWDVNLVMYSFDPSTFSTNCGGFTTKNLATAYSLPVYVPGQHNVGTSNYGPVASAETIDGKIYFPVNYSFRADLNIFCGITSTNFCIQSRLVCFDPSTGNGTCAGWSNPSLGGANVATQLVTGIFKDINNNDNPCVFFIDILAGSTVPRCYDKTSGSSSTVPANLVSNVVNAAATIGSGTLMASYEEVTTTNTLGQTITVFPFTRFAAAANSGSAGCYNWTLGDECTGWGSNGDGETIWSAWSGSSSVNGGDTRDYGYAVDDTGCLLGLGDTGWLWSFSADNGAVPCRRTISSVTINPSNFYCSGNGNVTGWDKVRVSNLDLSDFNKVLVTVNDSNGNAVSGYEDIDLVPTSGLLDISGIPYSGTTQNISVKVLFLALNNDPWSGVNFPVASVTFSGDDAQICYETIAQDTCNVPNIVNAANSTTTQLSDSTTDVQSATYSMALKLTNGFVCGTTTSVPNDTNGTLAGNLAITGNNSRLFAGLLVFVVSTIGILRRHKRVSYKI